MKEIYFDNAAATPLDPQVKKEIDKADREYANPSSYNDAGRRARKIINESRLEVARFLGAHKEEIIFTGSGSEANALAFQGIAKALKPKCEIISSAIEHASVLENLKNLEKKGFKIKLLKPGNDGIISIKDFENQLNKNTQLVSIMYVNNEIGTVQPILEVGKLIRKFRQTKKTIYPLFHVDACQAGQYLNLNVDRLGVDMLSINGSKIYGPKGIGLLYIRKNLRIQPLIIGGEQEFGLRAGTENIGAIAGLAKAIELLNPKNTAEISILQKYLFDSLPKILPEAIINGSMIQRIPGNINISIPNLSSEDLLLELDKYGIRAGSGAACTSHTVEPSHVLKAIGVEKKYINGGLRFSLGKQNTLGEVKYLLNILPKIVKNLQTRYGSLGS